MTKGNGLPCKRCGTSEWYTSGVCKQCQREHIRQWQKANPEKNAARSRQWQKANPNKRAERSRQWRKDNPEKHAERVRQWKIANPDKVNASTHRYRTNKTQAGGSYTAAEWNALCAHYDGKCVRCKKDNVKLTADHIKPVSKGGRSDISNIQPLCGKCNSVKGDHHIDYRPDAGIARWIQAKLFG